MRRAPMPRGQGVVRRCRGPTPVRQTVYLVGRGTEPAPGRIICGAVRAKLGPQRSSGEGYRAIGLAVAGPQGPLFVAQGNHIRVDGGVRGALLLAGLRRRRLRHVSNRARRHDLLVRRVGDGDPARGARGDAGRKTLPLARHDRRAADDRRHRALLHARPCRHLLRAADVELHLHPQRGGDAALARPRDALDHRPRGARGDFDRRLDPPHGRGRIGSGCTISPTSSARWRCFTWCWHAALIPSNTRSPACSSG